MQVLTLLESAHSENNMEHTEAVHEECSIECTCISSKKRGVKNLKRRLTPQGKGVKAIPSKKARIENKSDDCEKNNNTPKKSENNNENPQIQVEEGIQLIDIDWSKVEFIYKPVIVDQNPEALDMSDISIQK